MIPWIALHSSCFTTLQHIPDNQVRTIIMKLCNSVKRRLLSQRAKVVKQKAMAGVELLGAGAALTRGSMLLEEMVSSKNPQVEAHDNVYATDKGTTLFKV